MIRAFRLKRLSEAWLRHRYIGRVEGRQLEFKRSQILGDPRKLTEVVSAFLNSVGGEIVIGIHESNRQAIDLDEGFDQTTMPVERLSDILHGNVRPRPLGIKIEPVSLEVAREPNRCAYIVTVPAGELAYQAYDNRFYRRYDHSCQPMYAEEVRDLMFRQRQPRVVPHVMLDPGGSMGSDTHVYLRVHLRNFGQVRSSQSRLDVLMPHNIYKHHSQHLNITSADDAFVARPDFGKGSLLASLNIATPIFPGEEFAAIYDSRPLSLWTERAAWSEAERRSAAKSIKLRVFADNAPAVVTEFDVRAAAMA